MTQVLSQKKAAFDVEDYEDELSYDFSKYVKTDEGIGVTPEPSTTQVLKYQRIVKAIVKPALIAQAEAEELNDGERKVTAAMVRDAFSDEDDAKSMQAFSDLLDATAGLCSNKPSKSVLNKLPHRLKLHYVGYIAGKFLSGEASAPATKQ